LLLLLLRCIRILRVRRLSLIVELLIVRHAAGRPLKARQRDQHGTGAHEHSGTGTHPTPSPPTRPRVALHAPFPPLLCSPPVRLLLGHWTHGPSRHKRTGTEQGNRTRKEKATQLVEPTLRVRVIPCAVVLCVRVCASFFRQTEAAHWRFSAKAPPVAAAAAAAGGKARRGDRGRQKAKEDAGAPWIAAARLALTVCCSPLCSVRLRSPFLSLLLVVALAMSQILKTAGKVRNTRPDK
jgi:hypothetical protein